MRIKGWHLFDGDHERMIKRFATLMADTVMGAHDSQIVNFFATPLFADKEDLAYLQGSHAIKSLRLGPLGIRQLHRRFEHALAIHGLSRLDIDIQLAQFWVYYWTMTICLTNGTDRQLARKKVKESWLVVERLRSQIDGHPALSR